MIPGVTLRSPGQHEEVLMEAVSTGGERLLSLCLFVLSVSVNLSDLVFLWPVAP